jgi:hypothetical protein
LRVVCRGLLLAGGLLWIATPALAQDRVEAFTIGLPAISPGEFNGDLSKIPFTGISVGAPKVYRPRLQGPPVSKVPGPDTTVAAAVPPTGPSAPMPSTIQNFAGMSRLDACTGGLCGSGFPPDTNGDVGPNHYVQQVNGSVGIYSKTGTLLAAFTEDTLWTGVGSTPCNGNSFGDPITLYDWLADRFVLTWFAFAVDGSGNPLSPFYQCIAAAKTSDPVAGGWWLYAVRMDPGTAGTPPVGSLNDYFKLGLWHDCLYLAANEYLAPAFTFTGVAVASFSRADMYSGAPLTFSLAFLPYPANDVFTLIPSNNNGKGASAAQPGTPNYFVSVSTSAFAYPVRKFTAGPNCGGGGTLSAPTDVTQASYDFNLPAIPQPNTTNTLDNLGDRLMQKVQYRKVAGVESLWLTHNVQVRGSQNVAMQWAQLNVTGGAVAAAPLQEGFHHPDKTLFRWMGSIAADKDGNAALGYSTSNGKSPNFPSIKYAGRLASDPLNTLPQTEVTMTAGLGSQTNNCGGAPCDRWGDYSAMSVDPVDDCTFWYTNEYYDSQASGTAGNWHTRIGSFKFPSCVDRAKDSIGLYDAATQTFFLRNSNSTGPADITFGFGAAGDLPITGDWNGDGTDTVGVYRPSTGGFFLRNTNSAGPADIAFQFGVGGAVPLAGDWDGNGTTTIGIYDTATGTFFLRNSNSAGPADIVFTFGGGGAGVIPVVGDWNGDGVDTIGLYVVATGVFFLRNTNSSGPADLTFTFGAGGASIKPITGDWNNDGTTTIGLYNSSTGAFFLRNTNTNGPADLAFTFGTGGATPLAGDWDNLP